MITMTVTEASRRFSDLINRIRYRGESARLIKAGKPVALVVPCPRTCTGAELAKAWATLPRLGADEAALLEEELAAAKKNLPLPASQWD
ncbi:MAG: hypothetical protein U0984_08120 [Prosthecobacter sp.]|nr:hypothetical protein [Prosthecobacter sp.]